MARVLIRELSEANSANDDDMLIIEQNEEQTKKIKASNLLGDYIIESGSGTKGLVHGVENASKCFYRKWSSGVLEIWGYKKTNNINVNKSSWANGYESVLALPDNVTVNRLSVWGTWPVAFVDLPHVDFRITTTDSNDYSGDYMILHSMYGEDNSSLIDTKKNAPCFKLWRGTTKTLFNPTITFRAVGHWK